MAMRITDITMATTTMTIETTALLRLMSWLSPVFPTGGFAYSAGLEQAVANHWVTDTATLQQWIGVQLTHGSLWNDAVFFAQAHRAATDSDTLAALAATAIAMSPAQQRRTEACNQGISFVQAAAHWIARDRLPPANTPLPLCVGCAAGLENIALPQALAAYLHSFTGNQLQVAIRLSVTGQSGAAESLAALEPTIAKAAQMAATSSMDDLGSATVMADIAAMNHESLQPRLFLS